MSRWYVEHLGLTVARSFDAAPHTHFLADDTGRVFLELYSNPAAPYPDYATMPPLVLHVAFFARMPARRRRNWWRPARRRFLTIRCPMAAA